MGTNSIRLIVAEAKPDGGYRLIDDEKEVARLGRGMSGTGALSPKAMEESALVIARMKDIAKGYGVQRMRAVGTCAVREATNQREFLEHVQRAAGLDLEVISAEEEAKLAFTSVCHAFDLSSMAAAVVDIGGGSTEIVLSSGGVVEQISTLKLGAVRLTERFDLAQECTADKFLAMREHIRDVLKKEISKPPFRPQLVIGTGGTFTALASLAMHWEHRDELAHAEDSSPNVRGYEVQRAMVRHLLDHLRSLSPKARSKVPGLSPERADIIIAGMAIVDAVMRRLKVNTLRVHDRGIRDGLILSMVRELHPSGDSHPTRPPDRLSAVRQFARSCNYEQAHSEHVARLALQVFDQLATQTPERGGHETWRTPLGRELLEAAAVLHDVGYRINYAKHHKHSYHMIVHSELPGFTHREIEVIANVARYHRRANPKKSHRAFARLSAADQELVKRLASILRIVDGMDRAHAQFAKSVRLEVRDGEAQFLVHAESQPTVDMWGADRKSELFEKIFDLKPHFDWIGGSKQSSAEPAVVAK